MTLLKQYKRYYRLFREVSKVVHSTSDLRGILDLVVSRLVEGIEGRGAALCVLAKSSGGFTIRASCGVPDCYLSLEPLPDTELRRWPESDDQIHFIRDIFRAPRILYPKEAWEEGIRTILDVPLLIDGQAFGFIRIYFGDQREFSDDEIDFIWAVAEQSSCAINHDEEIQSHISQYNQLATKVDRMSSLGRMAAGIAHEINNPLTGILLYSSNLFKKAEKGPCRDGLEIIMQETQRCKKIIQGLLDFSREKKPQKVMANINKVIEKSLALIDNELFIRRIRVVRDLDYDIDGFFLDENQMEQVFVNLLFNSAHAIGEKGKIVIRSRNDRKNDQVVVEVEDNGCGIPKESLKKIFEPFFTTKANGTGLGLAVSYGIIKNHQGGVKIFSEPGVGTVITISLPVIHESENGGETWQKQS
jgi:signal transduction histidine kinase